MTKSVKKAKKETTSERGRQSSVPKTFDGHDPYVSDDIIRQHTKLKSRYQDSLILFKIDNRYEFYGEDALKSVFHTSGVLHHKIDGTTNGMPYNSFPHYHLDKYLERLTEQGYSVVICEQLEKGYKITNKTLSETNDMAKTKKANSKTDCESVLQDKTEPKSQKSDSSLENKPREPQMITVNGDKVTHGHAYQGNTNNKAWFFTAKLNGVQLKPQLMDMNDVVAFSKKELTIPQLMALYYPTKLMPKVPENAFKIPNVIAGPTGNLTVEKINVYKEKDPARDDFGKYKFYAKVDGKSMSAIASREDLNAYFDRVMTPGQIVEKNFGERLHLQSHYSQYRLPDSVKDENIRIAKSKEGAWTVQVDLGTKGKTSRATLSYDDGFSYFQAKSATKEQIAAKYLGGEIHRKLAQNETTQSKSIKI
jgi:DNA mismatch repair protein MutS